LDKSLIGPIYTFILKNTSGVLYNPRLCSDVALFSNEIQNA
jgi:hypothetical protein